MSILKASTSYEIMKLLEQHCRKGHDGYAEYESGWGDDLIAKRCGVNVGSVRHRRLQRYGRLREPTLGAGRPPKSSSLAENVAALEQVVFRLIEGQSDLRKKIDHLYSRLGEEYPGEAKPNGHAVRDAV